MPTLLREDAGQRHDRVFEPNTMGRYLVGALAGAVDIDARLCEDLLAHGVNRRTEITSTVIGIIGETNVFSTPEAKLFRDTRRNAWIGEGVGHALLMLAARHESSLIEGRVCTLIHFQKRLWNAH
jgi:hypothetical protein